MKTIRFNTFETNSSSCHSVTVFKNPKDWEDFKNNKTYLRRDMYDMEEHVERVNIINNENRKEYIADIKDLYNRIKEEIDDLAVPLRYTRYCEYDDKDNFIAKYLKEHFDFELMMKILLEPGDTVVCVPPKPISVRSYYDVDRVYTYEDFKVYDFYDFLFGCGLSSDDLPKFYVYGDDGDSGWTRAEVKELVDKNTGEEFVVVVRDEEC